MNSFEKNLISLPENSFFAQYKGAKYLVTKQTLLNGKLVKLYAKSTKDEDIVSGNYYVEIKNGLLKPCEMSPKKVIDFVNSLVVVK